MHFNTWRSAMDVLYYMVRFIVNDRECTWPSMFTSKEDAIAFADQLARMDTDGVKTEIHVYEVKEITYLKGENYESISCC